jgi:hypothetical protein
VSDDPGKTVTELVRLLSPSLGRAKAEAVVAAACRAGGVDSDVLTGTQTLAALEAIAHQPGIVGVTARFAKSRFILGQAREAPRTSRRASLRSNLPPEK